MEGNADFHNGKVNDNQSYYFNLILHVSTVVSLLRKLWIAQVLDGGNASVVLSTLMFSPIPDDHGKILKCRGENPALPDAFLEDFFQLNVVCEYDRAR